MKNQFVSPTPLESLLRDVDSLIVQAEANFERTCSTYYDGQLDVLAKVRDYIVELQEDHPTQQSQPDYIDLTDAIEPGEPGYREPLHETLDRILVKASEIGGSLKTINSMVASMAC